MTHVSAQSVLGQLVALEAALQKTVNRAQSLAEMAGTAYVAGLFDLETRQVVVGALATVQAEIERVRGLINAVETGAIGP